MKRTKKFYHFFIILPDMLYPFANKIQGEWVRGIRSYNLELQRAFKRYGKGYYGYKLATYRQVFHFLGSLLVLYVATVVAYGLLGSRGALVFLLLIVSASITYQEFFYQRRHYRQHWSKAIADWLVWVVPIGVYIVFFTF